MTDHLVRAAPVALAVALLGAPSSSATARPPTGPVAALTQADGAVRTRAATEPESLGLREQRLRGRTVWAQSGVAAAQIEWAVRGAEAATALLPTATGLAAPREPAVIYLFADGDAFRRLTSELTGLPPDAIHAFEGGRSYTGSGGRGIYLNAGAIPAAEQSARLVAHEVVHLAERDLIGARAIPRWFSEGLAEHVAQRVMAGVNPRAAAERRWRRSAVVASGLHRHTAFPISALTTPAQWNDAAAAGYDRFIYAEALLAVDWLVGRGGSDSPARLLGEVARDVTFAAALDRVLGLRLATLDSELDAALRADLLARFPVGIQVFEAAGPPGSHFQFAAVGLPPGEVLTREFVREDGYAARAAGAPATVSPSGVAYWTFQTRADSLPARWWLAVQGDRGTTARLAFDVSPPVESAPDP